jgi:hypothetical protein
MQAFIGSAFDSAITNYFVPNLNNPCGVKAGNFLSSNGRLGNRCDPLTFT